ncbi:MAG: nicotinamide-nucleotide amidohydrolase family protein [Planctomycetota bacterium]|nr:nicotinamide-nucleotide amidohydrolase family protein [Planctomycetota bacterium]
MSHIDLISTTSGMTAARQLSKSLIQHNKKLVLTESCTGGLVASWLTKIPGISAHFCGSAVVYRNETKHTWLDVPRKILIRPGPVSQIVAKAMARGVLIATPEADVAASITGHFGPDAPRQQDGLFFIGIASRNTNTPRVVVHRFRFPLPMHELTPLKVRRQRQHQAGRIVCQLLADHLQP